MPSPSVPAQITRVFPCYSLANWCFAASQVGTELAGGSWSANTAKVVRFDSLTHFRGDGRWIGLDRLPGRGG
jgi:hypothetical protein